MAEPSFQHAIAAAVRQHRESYGSNEPARMMEAVYEARGGELLKKHLNA